MSARERGGPADRPRRRIVRASFRFHIFTLCMFFVCVHAGVVAPCVTLRRKVASRGVLGETNNAQETVGFSLQKRKR